MPNIYNPYPISGIVYDIDGSTAAVGAQVQVVDTTQGKTMLTTSTDSNGAYMLDIGNLSSGYANGDNLYLIASWSDISEDTSATSYDGPNKCEFYRTTVNTTTGLEEKNLVLRIGSYIRGDASITGGKISNNNATVQYVILRELATGRIKDRIYIPASSTYDWHVPNGCNTVTYRGGVIVLETATGGISGASKLAVILYTGR